MSRDRQARMFVSARIPIALSILCMGFVPAAAAGQQTSLKTVPIATGDQFLLVPQRAVGMAGVTTGVRDTLGDPWANPAAGARVRGGALLAVPAGYVISQDIGAGLTLTLGGLGRVGEWFGGVATSFQQIENPNRNTFFFGPEGDVDGRFIDDALDNGYVQAFAGRRIGPRTSLGAAAFHADLTGIEGVSQLYAGSASIQQEGTLTSWRIGLLHELRSGAEIEAIAHHDRLDSRHDVGFWEFVPLDPANPTGPTTTRLRVEENLDRTNTSGLRVSLDAPLSEPGLTLGLRLDAKRKTHPKIPNYRIANLPRDPGNSTILAATAGIARRRGPTFVGMELSWIPARSHTWAEAEAPIPLPGGGVLPAGGRSVENWFRFSNFRAATAFEYDAHRRAAVRLGFGIEWNRYRLRQERYVEDSTLRTRESWVEWEPSLGVTLRPRGFRVEYTSRLHAKGFPLDGNERFPPPWPQWTTLDGVDFLPPVTQPVSLPDYTTWTNQLAIIVPLGR